MLGAGLQVANYLARTSPSAAATALVVTVCPLAAWEVVRTTPSILLPSRTLLSPSLTTVSDISSVSANSSANSRHLGIRVKATEGTTGTIKGVTYSGITLSSIAK